MEPFEDIEVDSVVDQQLPIAFIVSVSAEMVGKQHALRCVA